MAEQTDIYYKLGEMHGDIKSTLQEAQRTNGRVTKIESVTIPNIEKRLDRMDIRMAYYLGGIAVIIFVLNLIAPKIINSIFQKLG